MHSYHPITAKLPGMNQWQDTLEFYNPWWSEKPLPGIPSFRRDIFSRIKKGVLHDSRRALLIHGPRRVGKTTVIRQVIVSLIRDEHIDPRRILYFPLDHDDLLSVPSDRRLMALEEILEAWWSHHAPTARDLSYPLYAFLDEVQAVVGWQHVLKSRYLDQEIPIRFVLTGSSSQQVFRDAMEDLLDRVEFEYIRPGSFGEFVRFRNGQNDGVAPPSFDVLKRASENLFDEIDAIASVATLQKLFPSDIALWTQHLSSYFTVGGFLRYWSGEHTLIEQAEDLDRNYIQLVGLHDLRSMRAITNPEPYLVLLRYFFARPGGECNMEELRSLAGASKQTLMTGIDLLLRTELVHRVDRFRTQPGRERSVHAKLFPCDPALSVATTKKNPAADPVFAGALAETTVCAMLRRILSESGVTYFRPKHDAEEREVDFIARFGTELLPIEVKYQQSINDGDASALRSFVQKHDTSPGLLITKNNLGVMRGTPMIPLSLFLLLK